MLMWYYEGGALVLVLHAERLATRGIMQAQANTAVRTGRVICGHSERGLCSAMIPVGIMARPRAHVMFRGWVGTGQ